MQTEPKLLQVPISLKLHQALAVKTEPLRKADKLQVRHVLDPDPAVTPSNVITEGLWVRLGVSELICWV